MICNTLLSSCSGSFMKRDLSHVLWCILSGACGGLAYGFLGLHARETVSRVMKLWVCTCLESVD